MDDKRKFSRVPFVVKAQIDWQGKVLAGEVSNLSLRGMLVHVPETIPVGEKLASTLQLTGDSSDLKVTIVAKVVRTDAKGIGLEFEQMDLDSFIHLRNIVAYNSGNADLIDQEFMNFIKHRGFAI